MTCWTPITKTSDDTFSASSATPPRTRSRSTAPGAFCRRRRRLALASPSPTPNPTARSTRRSAKTATKQRQRPAAGARFQTGAARRPPLRPSTKVTLVDRRRTSLSPPVPAHLLPDAVTSLPVLRLPRPADTPSTSCDVRRSAAPPATTAAATRNSCAITITTVMSINSRL